MPRYVGVWQARVAQDFEVDADSEEEARELMASEMTPSSVAELLDIEITRIEEV